MDLQDLREKFAAELSDDPLLVLAVTAALLAIATTPIAFAVLGRMQWFQARRGRVLQRPSFSSLVVGMMLVMAIPAIFAALAIKSRSFDRNRYEFDPNRTWSVLEQGRGFRNLAEADAAVKKEMERLAVERKNLVEGVKRLDQAMLALRAVAGTSLPVSQAMPEVLQSLAGIRKSVGVDGPQQLMDLTAPPVELRGGLMATAGGVSAGTTAAPFVSASPAASPIAGGLTAEQAAAELAAVPEPQRAIAAMLPLTDLPAGWTVGKSGNRYVETFNAENLYEKINGRAESFIQYGVQGMAYTFYHPLGDPSNELQLYVFEMANPLKAFGKYSSEKPDEAQSIAVGAEGYTAAGSTLFYADRYYTQIVSTVDDPKFAAVALELARRVASRQRPEADPGSPPRVEMVDPRPVEAVTTAGEPDGAAGQTAVAFPPGSPQAIFGLLPAVDRQGDPKYVAQDVFGYSFLSDVFMIDYQKGDVTWQGFLRPYRNAEEAREALEKYKENVVLDGAELSTLEAEGADEMIVCSNIGLFDVIFVKGNTLGGANGATERGPAEAFARALARSLPSRVEAMSGGD